MDSRSWWIFWRSSLFWIIIFGIHVEFLLWTVEWFRTPVNFGTCRLCCTKYFHGSENVFIYPATVCVYIINLECPGYNPFMFIQRIIHPAFQHPMILLSIEICPQLFEITKLWVKVIQNELTSRWVPQSCRVLKLNWGSFSRWQRSWLFALCPGRLTRVLLEDVTRKLIIIIITNT